MAPPRPFHMLPHSQSSHGSTWPLHMAPHGPFIIIHMLHMAPSHGCTWDHMAHSYGSTWLHMATYMDSHSHSSLAHDSARRRHGRSSLHTAPHDNVSLHSTRLLRTWSVLYPHGFLQHGQSSCHKDFRSMVSLHFIRLLTM